MIAHDARGCDVSCDPVAFLRRPDRRLKLAVLLAEVAQPDRGADAFWLSDHAAQVGHLRQADAIITWLAKEFRDGY